MLYFFNRKNAVWLIAYLATMVGLVSLLLWSRERVIANLSNPAAKAEWEAWKREETARQAAGDNPVRRRPPKAVEPPAVILMRDSFVPIAGLSLVVGSLIFGFAMLVVRGGSTTNIDDSPSRDEPPRNA